MTYPPRKLARGLWYRTDINIADRSIARDWSEQDIQKDEMVPRILSRSFSTSRKLSIQKPHRKKNTTPSLTNDWNNGEIRLVDLKLAGPSRKIVARVIPKNIAANSLSKPEIIRILKLGDKLAIMTSGILKNP
jgi:hypothetical protein